MAKLTYYTAATLDGFIADPDDSLAWLFAQGGADPEAATRGNPLGYEEFIKGIGAIVMGSTTYQWVLAHERGRWPYELPAWVMTSRDLAALDAADIRFAAGEVKPVYEAMVEAAGGKDLWVVGGGDLAGQFADAGLLDEVITFQARRQGCMAPILAARGGSAVGIDVSAEQIATAQRVAEERKLDDRARFWVARAESTGLEASSFDLVIASQCWHWFDAEVVMEEMRRVLRPDGVLAIVDYCYLSEHSPVARETEELILERNPTWTMAGWSGVFPERFDDALSRLLRDRYPDPLVVEHRLWCVLARKPS